MIVHLVTNPAAGRGRALSGSATARTRLAKRVTVQEHRPSSAHAARRLLTELVADGAERVVVLGGDGIVHLAANALAGTETVLGIIAAGTGNDAATGLGLATDLDGACAAALGAARPIDLIESEAGLAITVAIVGFAVDVNERAERMRFPRGAARYGVATLAELPKLRAHPVTLVIDGVEHDIAPNLLAVANLGWFGGGMNIAPGADPSDGQLDVVVIGPVGRLRFGALLPTVFSGRHVNSSHVTVLRGSEVAILGDSLNLRADGEPWGELPATLRARPNALLVAAPR